jgi:hypothetical protein
MRKNVISRLQFKFDSTHDFEFIFIRDVVKNHTQLLDIYEKVKLLSCASLQQEYFTINFNDSLPVYRQIVHNIFHSDFIFAQ